MAIAKDDVRRLAIIAGSSYDAKLRRSNWLLEKNTNTDLLYLETDTPLDGKGSTLFLPYYGAMYKAGAVSPLICSDISSTTCQRIRRQPTATSTFTAHNTRWAHTSKWSTPPTSGTST